MAVIYEAEGARERIINNALALTGMERDERTEALCDVAVMNALAYCNREDVPAMMEGALALLLAGMMKNGGEREVKSLTRGDVSVTYSEDGGTGANLNAFVKLRAI